MHSDAKARIFKRNRNLIPPFEKMQIVLCITRFRIMNEIDDILKIRYGS